MIKLVCEQCGRKHECPDDLAGKQTQCQNCGQVLDVPFADTGLPDVPTVAPPVGQQQADQWSDSPLLLLQASVAERCEDCPQAFGPVVIPPEPLPSPIGKIERGVLAVFCIAILLFWSIQVINFALATITARRLADNLDAFSTRLDKVYDKEEHSSCKELWKELRSQCLAGNPGQEIMSRIKSIDDRLLGVEYLFADRWREAMLRVYDLIRMDKYLLYLCLRRYIKSDNWAAIRKVMANNYRYFYGPDNTLVGPRGLVVVYAMENSQICDDPARLEHLIEAIWPVEHSAANISHQRRMCREMIAFLVVRERYEQAVPFVRSLEKWVFMESAFGRSYFRKAWYKDVKVLLGALRRASRKKEAIAFLMRLKEIVFSDRDRVACGKYTQRELARWYVEYVHALDSSWGLSKDWLRQILGEYRKKFRSKGTARLRVSVDEVVFKRVYYPCPDPMSVRLPKRYRQGYLDVSTRNTKAIKKMWDWIERDRKEHERPRAWNTGIGEYRSRLMGYGLGVLDALDDIRSGTMRTVTDEDKRRAGR